MFGLSRGAIVIVGMRGKIFIWICLLLGITIFGLSHSISTFKRLWMYNELAYRTKVTHPIACTGVQRPSATIRVWHKKP